MNELLHENSGYTIESLIPRIENYCTKNIELRLSSLRRISIRQKVVTLQRCFTAIYVLTYPVGDKLDRYNEID